MQVMQADCDAASESSITPTCKHVGRLCMQAARDETRHPPAVSPNGAYAEDCVAQLIRFSHLAASTHDQTRTVVKLGSHTFCKMGTAPGKRKVGGDHKHRKTHKLQRRGKFEERHIDQLWEDIR